MRLLMEIAPWIGGLLSLGSLLQAFKNFRRRSLSKALPTSRALAVFIGLVEMKGKAECQKPLRARLTDIQCIHHEWFIEEEYEREETDSKGNTSKRSGWTTIDKGRSTIAFHVKDATGAILVLPQGAEIDAEVTMNRTCRSSDALYYAKGPRGAISDSTGRRRFREKAIRLHGQVYVVGKARERKDVVAAEIAQDELAPLFLISARSEKDVQSAFGWYGIGWTLLGLLLLLGGLAAWDLLHDRLYSRDWRWYLGWAGAYVGAWAASWVWNVFNDLIGLRNRVREGWVLIDIQLRRRHDLIPNLVRIVSALRDHESALQAQLATLRAQAGATMPGQQGADPQAVRPALASVMEKYPVLKAMPAFLQLQAQLVETEERIALARDYYNNIATHFNTRIEQLPQRFVALLAVMRRFELLTAQDFERALVKVDFAK
jgi:hypothetical protein